MNPCGPILSPVDVGVHCPVSATVVPPLHTQAEVALAWLGSTQSPHPWERALGAGLPPILTSASALYRAHTMDLGATPGPPATLSLCTAGKWALPSTTGRGSSLAGTGPHQLPDGGAEQL